MAGGSSGPPWRPPINVALRSGLGDGRCQAMTTAAQEGMTGGEENKLQEVLDAKKALEERDGAPNPANNPPVGSDAEVAKEAEIEKLDP